MTADQADEFAKRELRADIGRKGAEEIGKAALADAKFEGDYARIMTAAITPAPAAEGAATPGVAPAPGTEGAAVPGATPATETPAGETQKEQPKN